MASDKLEPILTLVRNHVEQIRPSVRLMRDSCAGNIQVFSALHELALSAAKNVDVTPFSNCAVHVSVVGRDLANFQLLTLDAWSDHNLTPTLISHFYLASFEFMERWPKALSEKSMRTCLVKIRADGFNEEIKSLNLSFVAVRDVWWSRLQVVRNNLAAHYDSNATTLLASLEGLNIMSFLELMHSVNKLQLDTVTTLTAISNEMQVFLRRVASTTWSRSV